MAPSTGMADRYIVSVLVVFICLQLVPFSETRTVLREPLQLSIPHNVKTGFTAITLSVEENCTNTHYVHQNMHTAVANPFHLHKEGNLVTNTSLADFIGDHFIITHKPECASVYKVLTPVSHCDMIQINVKHSSEMVTFRHDKYVGSICRLAPEGTLVGGITDLFACEEQNCKSDVDYTLEGELSDDLPIKWKTVDVNGQRQVQIFSTKALSHSTKSTYHFLLTAHNSNGLKGHTNVEIHVLDDTDDRLRYVPLSVPSREKRSTTLNLNSENVPETKTGVLFSVTQTPPAGTTWTYSLYSSTIENTFAVSETGVVSLLQDATLDYEIADKRTADLVITVKNGENVEKDLAVTIHITDVNDEIPQFTNTPSPFLTTVSNSPPDFVVVYTLTAMDRDQDAQLTLQADYTADPTAETFFTVDIIDGGIEARAIIKTKRGSVFPMNQELRIKIIATDTNADPHQQIVGEVKIKAGEREPQFKLTDNIEFQENNLVDQVIDTLQVVSFQDHPVNFVVLNQQEQEMSEFSAVALSATQGSKIRSCQILVKQIMDYEVEPRVYNVTIRATEQITSLFNTIDIQISVTDVNEFTPRFTLSTYTKESVREDITIGSSLLTVTASDEDFGTTLTFSVENDHFRAESVNPTDTTMPQTAVIYVQLDLDYDLISPKLYDFSVVARDNGGIIKSGEAVVIIYMKNLNDEWPVFPDNMTAKIRYDLEVAREVFIARATDLDQGDQISYSFKQPINPLFLLNSNTGRISLAQKIAEDQADIQIFQYKLGIIATDDGACCGQSNVHTSSATVTVNILTDNLNHPVFEDCNTYTPEVDEEASDAFVLSAKATDVDFGSNGEVTYSIRESNSPFRINSTSGELFTNREINRETLVARKISVTVIATDGGGLQGTCSLLVRIKDVNDNAPVFLFPNGYRFTVLQSLTVGSVAESVESRDDDIGENALVKYSLVDNPGDYFKIDNTSIFTGGIKVAKQLPPASTTPIRLTVMAKDNGVPSKSTNVTVDFTITNDNEELPPRWISLDTAFTAKVDESTPVNQINIITLVAESQISGNTLSFRVFGNNLTSDIFEMINDDVVDPMYPNRKTAVLQNKKPLDFESTTVYQITARVTDIRDRYTDHSITIDVNDVNDNKPYFLGTTESTGYMDVSLFEGNYSNVPLPGKAVLQLHASDSDGDPPNNLIESYHITGTTDADKMFTINPTTGWLYTTSSFDRESGNLEIYTITVTATDAAPSAIIDDPNRPNAHNSGEVTVKIKIEDVNDNPPFFDSPSYHFTVDEDKDLGSVVATMKAEDRDDDAVLSYSLSPTNVPFTIHKRTGDIKVDGELDFDAGQRSYSVIVTVDDSLYSSSTNVTIAILDVNDNPPVVADIPVFKSFVENDATIIGVVYTVTATDVDFGGSRPLYYKLSFTYPDDEQYFAINRNSGELSIIKPLDRDLPNGKSEFLFTVEVADAEPNDKPFYGYGTVTVNPLDVNDNQPFFPESARQLAVEEEQDIGARVGHVSVEDYDYGNNKTFTLQILRQNPIVVELGQDNDLKTTVVLDRETVDKYYVVMQAIDDGTPNKLTGTATLTITVTDINDNPPKFNQTYTFPLSEHQITGEVGRIKAYDADIGKNAKITYSLDGHDGNLEFFSMRQDPKLNEGVLLIFKKLDYDELGHRNFTLIANAVDSDYQGLDIKTAQTTINIIVSDYNDEVPKFKPKVQTVDIPENAIIGTTLATFTATDADVDSEYGSFMYFIAQVSDPLSKFAIDRSSGIVTVNNQLDRETIAVHTVYILAIDNVNGFPQNTGSATLSVTVTDINDNFPDFADYQPPSITENEPYSNSILLQISAVDKDLPENGPPFRMELNCSTTAVQVSAQCSNFSLIFDQAGDNGHGSAEIMVSGTFDREQEKVINLPINMCDTKDLCGIRLLPVTVLDKNDNEHGPGYQNILVYNYKGLFGNIVIGQVNVDDPDDSDIDKTYELVNPGVAGVFVSVDTTSGLITLRDNVPEMGFSISVDVRAEFGTGNPQRSVVKIKVVYLGDDAVFNSGSVRIKGITDEEFVTKPKGDGAYTNYDASMYDKFRQQLALKLYDSDAEEFLNKVHILNVNHTAGTDYTDIRYAAHGSPYFQSSRVDGVVSNNMPVFTATLDGKGSIDMVPIDMCQFETCEGGCYNELIVEEKPTLVNTKGASFVGVKAFVNGTCGCRATDFSSEKGCTPGYCYHGGECVNDQWGVISCTCPPGFDGPRCQQLRQSFDGTGYALYKQLEQCEDSRTSIDILTSNPNGLILYNGPTDELIPPDPRDYISLELKGGFPVLRIDHGTGEKQLEIQGANRKRLSDGVWHTIDIFRNKKTVRMVVDHCDNSQVSAGVEDRSGCEATGITLGENIYINVDKVMQLGGRFSTPSYPAGLTTSKFVGCMRNLVHNAEIYDLSTGGNFPGATDGCQLETDACTNGCYNGQCLITGLNAQGAVNAICNCYLGRRASSEGVCDIDTTTRLLETESFMDWNLKNNFKKVFLSNRRTTISFQFRTRDETGVMFSITDVDHSNKYINVSVQGKLLRVSYNIGDGSTSVTLSSVPVSDGAWHVVTMDRFGKEFILKLDSGENRYYADTPGPTRNGETDFNVRPSQIYSGANLKYNSLGVPSYDGNDLENSCLNDIRFDYQWFPMTDDEEADSPIATIERIVNTKLGCERNDCEGNKCSSPFICVPLWGNFSCRCQDHFIRDGFNCTPINYCDINSCFGVGECIDVNPCEDLQCTETVDPNRNYFTCKCPSPWYGNLCQCHPDLDPDGAACFVDEPKTDLASLLYVGIGFGALVLIAVIVILVWWLCCRRLGEKDELLDDDADEDIRENVMYYDEEGAGEEDQTGYDLSRLRKPDDGEHTSPWDDRPDISKRSVKPLGQSDRPDIGDFITQRLDDADDDPGSPPFDTAKDFGFEGEGSDVGSLSSLNTTSSGDQDYDYLHNWGPKFAKLADMYNQHDESD